MKKLLLVFSFIAAFQSRSEAQFGGSVSIQTFYDELSPYGIWSYYPEYGGYVWAPDAGRYFRPYGTNGRWVYTHYGWTWVSGYTWGWAPFHYGRWIYDDWRGWLWIPGYDWAPAWVAWGTYGGNYGWAPLGPNINISIHPGWRPPAPNWWTFVPRNRFGNSNWQRYAITNNTTVISNNITVINNVYNGKVGSDRVNTAWFRGPDVSQVERDTRTRIRPVEITNTSRPGQTRIANNKMTVYRPAVSKRPEARPGKVEDFDKLRPVSKLPGKEPAHNTRPANRETRPAKPVTRPVTPQPGTTKPATRPSNPKPAHPSPSARPSVKPASRGARPTRPAEKREAAPSPQRRRQQ